MPERRIPRHQPQSWHKPDALSGRPLSLQRATSLTETDFDEPTSRVQGHEPAGFLFVLSLRFHGPGRRFHQLCRGLQGSNPFYWAECLGSDASSLVLWDILPTLLSALEWDFPLLYPSPGYSSSPGRKHLRKRCNRLLISRWHFGFKRLCVRRLLRL